MVDPGVEKRLSETTFAELLEGDGGTSTKGTFNEGDAEKDAIMATVTLFFLWLGAFFGLAKAEPWVGGHSGWRGVETWAG